ncbi:Methyltransferase-like protein [Taphrina deformans PYCC 5710]|uniref:tRNA N(3)-methylcytidine methyltransferase n=1 Tax=Taphrina deformans (strain PYCC 5710 / ATCC 11124 / CBS 356.35 / IMI 108563 / JCM 9778 / NBRC 8474) TaxID=1097556 RepID=R4XAJ6_TAPDE|nr:Methyltransferase-like protein [Taphrina deformans PYCC 5710]|eukprot:CCG81323.1 Methyltransferase-like protein [Taphrina deformans PYCC 5710]
MPLEDDLPSTEGRIPCLKPFWQNKYKATAGKNWNDFYKRNTTNFFKDRHWLDHEFPLLLTQPNMVGMEVGCGVGNLIYPALERNESLTLFACDFSETAVGFVKSNERYEPLHNDKRLEAFVSDITLPNPFAPSIGPSTLDFITCIFVLSAIPPEKHVDCLRSFTEVMKDDGVICFRDYAAGDLAQLRFQKAREVPKLQDFLYVRQDGTMSYFFSEEYFRAIVAQVAGLHIEKLERIERRTKNIKRGLDEARYFLQVVLCKKSL